VILPYTNDEPAVLIADAYSAHVTPEVKQFCKDHHLTYSHGQKPLFCISMLNEKR
jgi:hypothetical protein